ncbi:hypothetical protein NVP1197A_02 [Vibrio phage 1.197.A._10N.286.54.F2]|nr:hypothetical protein NVP1197A_02 [Vibrio phage 1.197.A._10N.286.54.F2]
MKVSKWFKSEVRLHGDIIECDDFAYAEMSCEYVVDGVDAGVAICHAVNNHDRMADEIAELREACIGIYDDFAYEEIISMSPSIFEAWNLGMKFKNK